MSVERYTPQDQGASAVADRAGGLRPEPEVSALSGAHPSRFKLKAYRVHTQGFSGYLYYANSRGKALRDAWYGYCNYRPISFGDFLRIARAYREWPAHDDDFGAPLTVDGKPAFYVSRDTQYVQIAWPDGDGYSCAHPLEIEPQRFRPPAYRDRDASLAEDPKGLSGEAVAARAAGRRPGWTIAQALARTTLKDTNHVG